MSQPLADRAEVMRRDALIMRLLGAGQSPRLIRKALGQAGFAVISEHRIRAVIRRELGEARDARKEMGELIFDQTLGQLELILESMHSVLTSPCLRCKGQGHIGQDPDQAPGVNMMCDRCSGDRKHFRPHERVAASKEFRAALAEKSKMLGHYAPEKFAFTDPQGNGIDFSKDYVDMPLEDLDKEWAAVQAVLQADANERTAKEKEHER